MGRNLSNLYISESFQYLIQYSGSDLQDGLGNSLTGPFNVTASFATSASQAVTASYALNAGVTVSTASLLVTASATNNVITFTKGDSSTFNVTVATGSAVTVNTGSLLTTASFSNAQITFTKGDGSTFSGVINNVTSSISASFATNATSASFASTSTSASHALTANNATSASFASSIASGLNITASNVLVSNNLIVNGTASFAYTQTTTGSAVYIGDSFIVVNTNPTSRYAGLVVVESGSSPATTASLQFDSVTNDWFYEYTGSDPTNFGVAMFGPEYATKGSPTYLTNNKIPKGNGSHHLNDSNITDDGTTVSISTPLVITGSVNASSFTGSLQGTASFANNATSASFASTSTSSSFATSASQAQNATSASLSTSSSFASTASFTPNALVTASVSSNVITFTKGDGSTFPITVNTGSGGGEGAIIWTDLSGSNNAIGYESTEFLRYNPYSSPNSFVSSSLIFGEAISGSGIINVASIGGKNHRFFDPDGNWSIQNAAIIAGVNNAMYHSGSGNFIIGGQGNLVQAVNTNNSGIIGSTNSRVYTVQNTVIVGGQNMDVRTSCDRTVAAAGQYLTLDRLADSVVLASQNITTDQGPILTNTNFIGARSITVNTVGTNVNNNQAIINVNGAAGTRVFPDEWTLYTEKLKTFAGASLTGSVLVSGSLVVNGETVRAADGFPYTGSAQITGSLTVVGSINTGNVGGANTISGIDAAIIGGRTNNVSGNRSVVLGGYNNTINQSGDSGQQSSIIGGRDNTVDSQFGTVINSFNATAGYLSTVVGAGGGTANGNGAALFNTEGSSISNGYRATIIGAGSSTMTGGNEAYNVIIGGESNISYVNGAYGTSILGGESNVIRNFDPNTGNSRKSNTTIIGGNNNRIDDGTNTLNNGTNANSFIIGGRYNNIKGKYDNNNVNYNVGILASSASVITAASQSAILGGSNNLISGSTNSVILGGSYITASASDTVYVPNLVITGSAVTASITNVIGNWTDTYTSSPKVSNIVTLTQAEYDAISGSANPNTMYVISDTSIGTPATLTGNQTFTGTNTFTATATFSGSVRGDVSALSISSNTASLDLSTGNFFTIQLVSGSNTYINPTNILPGQTINLRLNTTGSGTVSFPSSVKQVSGSAYVPTTTTGVDIVTLISFDSTNLYLSNVKNLI